MAVYEQRYKAFDGPLTPQWQRFLVIPRHAYGNIFKSKMFTSFYAVCFVPLLIASILIYLHHNATVLALMRIPIKELIPIDNTFFEFFVFLQGVFGFLLVVFVGPRLVARDVTDNAIALYLCRPFSRTEYVLGKLAVLLILLSLITWLPLLMLFALQGYLEGGTWLARNAWMAIAITVGSGVWILLVALLSQALSAWVKWATAARGALVALYIVPVAFGAVINSMFKTKWGAILSIRSVIRTIWGSLFHLPDHIEFPVAAAWIVVMLLYAGCLIMLARKVRAFEVVR